VAGGFSPERVPNHGFDSSRGQVLKIYLPFTEQKRIIVGIMRQNLIKNIYHSLKVIYHSLKLSENRMFLMSLEVQTRRVQTQKGAKLVEFAIRGNAICNLLSTK